LIFKGTQQYPAILERVASEMAQLRTKLSADVYSVGSEGYRGKQENTISYLGILGELVAQNFLIENNIPFESALIVDTQPLPEPDITIDGIKMDVKAVKPNTYDLYVNYKAHLNEKKKCEFYWFVKLEDNHKASHYLASYSEVNNWTVKELRYTKAFVNKIKRNHTQHENNGVFTS